MKILLTGATGVLGRRVVPMLVSQGHHVTAVGRTPDKRRTLEQQGAAPIDLDLFNAQAVADALKGQDAVINLATHIPASSMRMMLPGGWRDNDRIRREVSANLAGAAVRKGISRFVQESYAPAYPDRGDEWITESTALEPAAFNRTLLAAEAAADRVRSSGAAAVTLRFASFYGDDARQIDEMIAYVRKGFAPLPGSPDAFISSVSHDDAARAVVAALTLPSGIYNVSDDQPLTHREFVDSLADALRVRHPRLPSQWMTILFGSVGAAAARSIRASNRKLRGSSSWAPTFASVRDAWPAVVTKIASAPVRSRNDQVA